MTMAAPLNIAFVGAGNVATHLAKAFRDAGHRIRTVVSKNGESARRLAADVGCEAVDTPLHIPHDCDMVVVCTNDSSVETVAAELPRRDWIVVHTSGSVPLDALARYHDKCGAFYPLQTFSRDVAVDMSRVPLFLEASDETTLRQLEDVAHGISDCVEFADSARRKVLHVAGVFASNFPIYILQLCEDVLACEGLRLGTVRPLVEATVAKVFAAGAEDALTGPARRGDRSTVGRHLELLGDGPAADVYKLLSDNILNKYHPEK